MTCRKCRSEMEVDSHYRPSSTEARAHIVVCERCRLFGAERLALKSLLHELEPVETPPDYEFRLRSRLAAEKYAQRQRRALSLFVPSPALLSLTGCCALVLAVAVYLKIPGGTQNNDRLISIEHQTRQEAAALKSGPFGTDDAKVSPTSSATSSEMVSVFETASAVSKARRAPSIPRRIAAPRRQWPVATPRQESADTKSLEAGAPFMPAAVAAVNYTGRMILVEVGAPSRPMHIELRDSQGGSRMVTIDPVGFGSRDVVNWQREAKRDSISSQQGAW